MWRTVGEKAYIDGSIWKKQGGRQARYIERTLRERGYALVSHLRKKEPLVFTRRNFLKDETYIKEIRKINISEYE